MNEKYDHKEIEKKWQEKWQEDNLYKTPDEVAGKNNFYALVEFPYPSGNLHIGHWYAFAVPDIFVRAKRMQGFNVMFPIGFDAFGLPAENAAIKNKVDPRKWTYENIAYMEKQLQSMGNSFDWSRKVITADPEYYKWTQWLFLKLYEKGLAYKKKASVNWCPSCNTVLANEQVKDGKCERCDSEVIQKDLEQWFFKITDYAERLLSDMENLDWPEEIKTAQRNWIGKSEGTSFKFEIRNPKSETKEEIEVFTTRADTLFGVTYLVLAPEHPWLAQEILNPKSEIRNKSEIQNYINQTKNKTEIERTDAKKDKTGVEIKGIKVVNPANGEEVPVFVADYVLGNYGTGAVMAVPAHDDRDFEFAKKYDLPIKNVIAPYFCDPANPFRPNKEIIFRKVVHSIIINPKNNKVLCLEWKNFPWNTFVIGGVEGEETNVEAALREIKEETGYKNLKFIKNLAGPFVNEFYAAHKDINRIAQVDLLLFELENEEKETISDEEDSKHSLVWVDKKELKNFIRGIDEKEYEIEAFERGEEVCFTGEGVLVNSPGFELIKSEEAREKIAEKFGEKVTKYKLRDWLLSRQRYWGCPIPVVYGPDGKAHPIPEEHLPWLLPEDIKDFAPKGESPIATSKELKERVEKIFGKGWTPECDTMDTFVDSSWYFIAYCISANLKSEISISKQFQNSEIQNKLKSWMPVSRYSGGAEHTNMHLLYSRFFHKALFDLGLVNEVEPFSQRMNRGLILGPDGQKMSKSKGNVVDPDEQVEKVGSVTVKMYLAFIGPYNETGQYPWDLGGVVGIRRFLERVWRLKSEILNSKSETNSKSEIQNSKLENLLHKTIKKVTEDIQNYKFNTAISAMMILLNQLESEKAQVGKSEFEIFLKLLAPFAPHMTEEIWHKFGHTKSIHLEEWPKYDESKIKEENANIVVQINGKIRAQFEAPVGISESDAKEKAETMPEVQKWLENKEIKKVIFVPNKIINFVLKQTVGIDKLIS